MAKISLKKGGKTVNGKFVANKPKGGSSAPAPKPSTSASGNSSSSGGSASGNEQALAAQLAQVSAQAKGLGIDTTTADAMVEQTRVEGNKPFAGSTYEKAVTSGTPIPTTPAPLSPQDIAAQVAGAMPTNEQANIQDQTPTEDYAGTEVPDSPYATTTDNKITNAKVARGELPQSSAEIYPNPDYPQGQQAPTQRQLTASDYELKVGESIPQYHDRIARLRGETVSELPAPQPDTYTGMQQKFGLGQTPEQYNADPISTIKDISKQILSAMGYDQAASEYTSVAKELEDLENDKDDEIREINDNPWLTEGVRIRQIQKAEEKYEDRIGNRINKLQLLDSVRDDARQQAQYAIGTAVSMWDSERRFQQTQQQMAYDQAEREFQHQAKIFELSQPKGSDHTSEMKEYLFTVEKQGFKGSFLDYKQAIAAAGRAPSSEGGGGLTMSQLLGYTNQVEDNFRSNPAAQNFTQLVNFGVPSVIDELNQNPSSVNDTILMRTLAKITDPTTGVREGEYETFESSVGALPRIYNLPKSWIGKGRLTDLGRQQMGNLIKTRYEAARGEYNNQYNYYNTQASYVGASLPPQYQVANPVQGPQRPSAPQESVFNEVATGNSGTGGGAISAIWGFLTGN